METRLTISESERIRGIIYGLAIGDALGKEVEFLSKEELNQLYPQALTDFSQIRNRPGWQRGEWTDDTAQMLCILDSLIEKECIDIHDIARRFHQWYETDGRGIGQLTQKVITSRGFLTNPCGVAEYWWNDGDRKSAPNGAVMRTAVLGIWGYQYLDQVVSQAALVCRITHADQRCVASCVAVSVAIALLLQGNSIFYAMEQAEQHAEVYSSDVREIFELACNGTLTDLWLDESRAIGYTYKSLSAGLWALRHANSFEDGLIRVINEGGDADTNGAVTGSLLGARFGFSAIPGRFVTGLANKELLEGRIQGLLSRSNDL